MWDRIDIHIEVPAVDYQQLTSKQAALHRPRDTRKEILIRNERPPASKMPRIDRPSLTQRGHHNVDESRNLVNGHRPLNQAIQLKIIRGQQRSHRFYST